MNNIIDKLAESLTPFAAKLGNNRYLTVLRDAFMLAFPLTMFGSIVVVFNNLPFFPDALKGSLSTLLGNGQNATMSIMTVFVAFGIGYYLTKSYDEDGVFGGVVALASFLATEIYVRITKKGIKITMPDGVPDAVSRSFSSLIPAISTLTVFLLINAAVVGLFNTWMGFNLSR